MTVNMRSSRRYYYLVFIFIILLVWSLRRFSRGYEILQEDLSWNVAVWSSPELSDNPVEDAHRDGERLSQAPTEKVQGKKEPEPELEPQPEAEPEPVLEVPEVDEDVWNSKEALDVEESGSGKQKSSGKKTVMDESDASTGDDVEKLDAHDPDVVDFQSKLHHTDDDNADTGVEEHASFDAVTESVGTEKGTKKKPVKAAVDSPTTGFMATQEPSKGQYQFPSWAECESLREKADSLPNMILFPFEDVVADTKLEGWEDDWVARAEFTGDQLPEPKIDFVYNCKPCSVPPSVSSSTDPILIIVGRGQWDSG